MAYTPIRDEVAIASSAIALLERDTGLAGTIWRDPVPPETFARKKDDTVSIYLPAYAVANKRALRANANRVRSTLKERKVDVSLENDLQVDVDLTDEQLTLDTDNLVRQVIAPSIGAIVRAYDEEVAALMAGATYELEIEWDATDPYETLVDLWTALDDHQVPMSDRHLALGSTLMAQLKKDDLLVSANRSGSAQTLRRGVLGDVAGFVDITPSPFLAPTAGFAYHRTAYALASRAPSVPDGVAWGNVQSQGGFSVRVMQHLTQNGSGDLLNVVYHDSWFGASVVPDDGAIDENGKFIPAVDPDGEGQDSLLVRAVKIGSGSSS